MQNQNPNPTAAQDEKKKKRRKMALFLALSGIIMLLIFGIIAAYYSDYIERSANLNSHTLRINGNYTFLLNEVETAPENIGYLNPGDVIVIRSTVTNTGSQSAWIREIISFTPESSELLPYLRMYEAELTQDDFEANENITEDLLDLTGNTFTSAVRVIDGTGDNAQTESGTDFEYIGSNSYATTLTLYFMHSAPNATQGLPFNLNIATQALQFRNNNTDVPDETAWATVTPAVGG